MRKQNHTKNSQAFTLTEILVVVFIITISALGVGRLSVNKVSEKEQLNVLNNKIKNAFEEVRNNSLLGKGIGSDITIPEQWKIEFDTTGNGSIKTYYHNDTGWNQYDEIKIEKNYQIKEIECSQIDGTNGTTTETGIIEMQGSNLILKGDCNNTKYKKMKIKLSVKNNFTESLEINSINGLIEIVR